MRTDLFEAFPDAVEVPLVVTTVGTELREWLGQAMPGMLTLATGHEFPTSVRTWIVRVHPERDTLDVYLLASAEPAIFDALVAARRAALTLVELPSYRARMFKGDCVATSDAPDATFVAERLRALGRSFLTVGMPEDTTERMIAQTDPSRAMRVLRLEVDAVYDQSPGRGAGARL